MTQLPRDFKEFFQLLNKHQVEYLLIGGYAVGLHGYVRNTNDIDFWISLEPTNIQKTVAAIAEFGFSDPEVGEILSGPRNVLRIGVPPLKLEITSQISGVEFSECYAKRVEIEVDGVLIKVINLGDLRRNKQASGRPKDIADLAGLPEPEDG